MLWWNKKKKRYRFTLHVLVEGRMNSSVHGPKLISLSCHCFIVGRFDAQHLDAETLSYFWLRIASSIMSTNNASNMTQPTPCQGQVG